MDPVHLQQIMMNLSLNARDAMDGSGTLSIGVKEAQIAGEVCRLSPADRGSDGWSCRWRIPVRITPDAEEHLFEPFFTTKPVGQGSSGMGLAVVHGIMTRLDGHIIA